MAISKITRPNNLRAQVFQITQTTTPYGQIYVTASYNFAESKVFAIANDSIYKIVIVTKTSTPYQYLVQLRKHADNSAPVSTEVNVNFMLLGFE